MLNIFTTSIARLLPRMRPNSSHVRNLPILPADPTAEDCMEYLAQLKVQVERRFGCTILCIGLPCNITIDHTGGGSYVYTDDTFWDARPFGPVYRYRPTHGWHDILIILPIPWQQRASALSQLLGDEGDFHWDNRPRLTSDEFHEQMDRHYEKLQEGRLELISRVEQLASSRR